MPIPFPGMDPWLEGPGLWPQVHHGLITFLQIDLAQKVGDKFAVAVILRTYTLTEPPPKDTEGLPDVMVLRERGPAYTVEAEHPPLVIPAAPPPPETPMPITVTLPRQEEIEEYALEVRKVESGELVTAIELLSPTNKQPGDGRKQYEEKRQTVLRTPAHLVEIDLLRIYKPMTFFWEKGDLRSDYRILISRAYKRPNAELYPFNLRDLIPRFPVPLEKGDPDVTVDLRALLDDLYDRARYVKMIPYRHPPEPPLSESDMEWAAGLLREQGLR
ncbi:MAG: DUF4058 family protein [Chloroflexi bacterium]|nr:DUF4058 family protein [Chloroflexota bacterium]